MIGLAHFRAALSGAAAIPAFLISFQNGVLDPRVSFTRSSQATLFDATGRLTFAPNNLLTNSGSLLDFGLAGMTRTLNATIAPGGASASMLTASAGAVVHRAYFQANPSGRPAHMYLAKAGSAGWLGISVSGAGTTSGGAFFNLTNGTVGTIYGAGNTAGIIAAGSGWYWCWVIAALANGYAAVEVHTTDAQADNWAASGTETLYICNGTCASRTYETSPPAYVATTTAAYYGPAFDYDPVTLAPRGLQIFPAATNKVTGSERLAGWALDSGLTRTATTGLDGTASATLISELAGGALSKGFRSPNTMTLAGVVETSSIYAKYAGRRWLRAIRADSRGTNRFAWFDIQNGAVGTVEAGLTASIQNASGGFYRCTVSGVTPAGWTSVGVGYGLTNADADTSSNYSGTPGAGIIIQAPQFEAGAVATSYIPTGTSAVARAADIVRLTPPAGASTLRFTFDDNATQDVIVTPGLEYTIPTTLNRQRIKSIR